MEERREYRYYAFISYSHKDSKWAVGLQNFLQRYRIPAVFRKEKSNLPKRVTPVFLDRTDLTGGGLADSLREELENSRYLILICSPRSAGSPWVNDEVRHFISLGRTDRIIPLIVDGEPGATDPDRECFPPALRELPREEEPLGISAVEYGRRGAFLRVLAALLQIRLDSVIARDAAYRRRQRALRGLAAALALGAGLFSWWYFAPHHSYFREVAYQWGKPVGVGPVSAQERPHLSTLYHFVTRRNRVERVEYVNSLLTPVEGESQSGMTTPISLFYYEDDGPFGPHPINRVEHYSAAGDMLYEEAYTGDLRAVDIVQPQRSSQFYLLSADRTLFGEAITRRTGAGLKSEITRYIQTYTEEGYLAAQMFMRDNRNRPAPDAGGIYGIAYEYNSRGLATAARYLDRDGSPMTSADGETGQEYRYDDAGVLMTALLRLGPDGAPRQAGDSFSEVVWDRDGYGNVTAVRYLNAQGKPTIPASQGYAGFESVLDDRGLAVSQISLGTDGKPMYDQLTGTVEARFAYDDLGRATRLAYFDAQGEPVCSDGVAVITLGYDEAGHIDLYRFFDTRGEPAPHREYGVYGRRYTFDCGGRVTLQESLDADEDLMTARDGAAVLRFTYDEDGMQLSQANFGPDGEPVPDEYGVWEYRYEYTDGNPTLTRYLDADGKPCIATGTGAAQVAQVYEDGLLRSSVYLDGDGARMENLSGYAEIRYEYDDSGREVRRTYHGVDGSRVISTYGFSTRTTAWDGRGLESVICYYDTVDALIPGDGDGSWPRHEYTYDAYGKGVEERFYTADGALGRVDTFAYDDRGNETFRESRDGAGTLRLFSGERYARRVSEHNERNHWTRSLEYGTDGQLLGETRWTYDERGDLLTAADYGPDGALLSLRRCEYDDRGDMVRVVCLDEDGSVVFSPDMGYAVMELEHDLFGNVTGRSYYDAQGREIAVRDNAACLYFQIVQEDSEAWEAGLREGDVLLRYNDWTLPAEGGELSGEGLSFADVFEEMETTGVTVAVARIEENGLAVHEFRLPAGTQGFALDLVDLSKGNYDLLYYTWLQWHMDQLRQQLDALQARQAAP